MLRDGPGAVEHGCRVTPINTLAATPGQPLHARALRAMLSYLKVSTRSCSRAGTSTFPQVWPDTGGQVACGSSRGNGGRFVKAKGLTIEFVKANGLTIE